MTESEWSQVGARIRAARTFNDRSQENVAAELGIDRTAFMRMESGARKVSAIELGKLARMFDVPLSYFVFDPPPAVVSRRTAVPDSPGAVDLAVWRLDVDLDAHGRDVAWLASRGLLAADDVIEPAGPISDTAAARELARSVRERVGARGPLGDMADVLAHWGLFTLVVDREGEGASMQIDDVPGIGASVIGGRLDPGRRRFNAAHELGHHILRDPYTTDVGVSASTDERERVIDAFAQELLLPLSDLRSALQDSPDNWQSLVEISARYRVSWSVATRMAGNHDLVPPDEIRAIAARKPVRGDFIKTIGRAPMPDLTIGATAQQWQQAVISAYQSMLITGRRAIELLHGSVESVEELPERDAPDPEI